MCDRVESAFHVFVRRQQGRIDQLDDSRFVDDNRHSSRYESQRVLDSKQFPETSIDVADQRKRQSMLLRKVLMTFFRIRADSNHLETCLGKYLVRITKRAGFLGTDGGTVFGIEEQDDSSFAQVIGKTDSPTV